MKPALSDDDPVDLCGRIMGAHALDPELASRALGIERGDAERMIRTGSLSAPLSAGQRRRLDLFTNIIIRMEWHFQYDSRLIRRAWGVPLDLLGGIAPADMLNGDLSALRVLRRAVDQMDGPKLKWWRVGH